MLKALLKKIFAPGNDSFLTSLGLLLFRVWIGLTTLLHHGLDKLSKFGEMSSKFPDPFHVSSAGSLALVIFAEVVASALLVAGLTTRFAAFVAIINMSVAFFLVHQGALGGEHPGELAFIYLAGYVLLFIAGPGKLSLDKAFFSGKSSAGS